jgi:hypothetical protein
MSADVIKCANLAATVPNDNQGLLPAVEKEVIARLGYARRMIHEQPLRLAEEIHVLIEYCTITIVMLRKASPVDVARRRW